MISEFDFQKIVVDIKNILAQKGSESATELIPHIIAEVIFDKKSTSGKAPDLGRYGGITSHINAIPSSTKGPCAEDLLVLCFDKDKLSSRLTEMVYHSGIYCLGKNRSVVFITTKWDDSYYPHKRAIEILKQKGINYIFVLMSNKGAAEFHV